MPGEPPPKKKKQMTDKDKVCTLLCDHADLPSLTAISKLSSSTRRSRSGAPKAATSPRRIRGLRTACEAPTAAQSAIALVSSAASMSRFVRRVPRERRGLSLGVSHR